MPIYRYFTADVLTGVPAIELPQYGVTCDKQLSGAGSYSGFIRLGTGLFDDNLLLSGTIPGQHALIVQRDGVNIWGGPIITRTYAAEGQTLQINASTFESIFDRLIMENDQIHQNVEQQTILTNWLTGLQAQTGCNFNLVTDIAHDNSQLRTILIPAYEYHMASDLLLQMVGVNGGIDYTINLAASGDNPARTLKVRYALNSFEDSGAFYDFPGTISKYWASEQGNKVARKNVALGAGTGNQLMKSVLINSGMGAWPMWGAVESYPDIGDQAGLNAKAQSMQSLRTPPVYAPTFELSTESLFSGWNDLGKLFSVQVTDVRFPKGITFNNRLTGWALTPATKDSVETIQFTLESDS